MYYLQLNTRKAWEGPAIIGISLSIVQVVGDKRVSIDESRVRDKSEGSHVGK